jgi:phage terminase large subunit-like protein
LDEDGLRKINLAVTFLPKKNYKSTLAGGIAGYGLLCDGESEVEIYGTAGSRDQARIVFGQTVKAFRRSPILLNEVNIFKDAIERKDGSGFYKVLSAEGPLQHGLNPHFVVWDEIWNQPNYALWEALTHSPARKQPLHYVTSYVGYRPWAGDLCYDLFTAGKSGKDKRMHFFYSQKNLASIVTPEYLEQQRRRLPEHIFRRLHKNEWTTGSGTFLNKADIDAAISSELEQKFQGEPGLSYFLALDLGLRRDRTVVAVVHKDPDNGLIILDHLYTFEAPKGREVQISDVEQHILDLAQSFPLSGIVFDPWQSIRTKQRLEEKGLRIEEFIFSGTNLTKLTQNLFSLFRDRRIKIFEHRELVKELLSVQIVEKSYGYRIDHQAGAHDDCVVALGMAALAAMQTKAESGPIFHGLLDLATMNIESTTPATELETMGPRQPRRIRQEGK